MPSEDYNTKVPVVVTPPEIAQLHSKLDAIDEKIEFVMGEVAQKEGLKIGSYIGFLYGFIVGTVAAFFLYMIGAL
ncbi:MAG: tetrahydromethanopterin S-methyltransferase subunit G [Thermoproteota archaeon]